MTVPAAVACLPLLAGVIAGLAAFDHGIDGVALSGAVAALLALLSAVGACSLGANAEMIVAIAVGCGAAGASLGATSASRTYQPPLLRWFELDGGSEAAAPVSIEGVLREDASVAGAAPTVVVDVRGAVRGPRDAIGAVDAAVLGGVRLTIAGGLASGRMGEWRAGRAVRMPALLRLPSVYLDPGVRDERRALARRGIVLVGTVKSGAMVDVVGRGSAVQEAAAATRAWVRRRLAADVGRWSPRSAAIATAVLIGDRSGLPDADVRRLQDAGTYHVIAISGGNIAILTLLALAVLSWLNVPSRPAAAITMILLIAYHEIVVPAASVERAVTAALLYLAARLLDQRGPALNVLAVAALLGLTVDAVVLLDPGFLLSFGATLGILLVAGASTDRTSSEAGSARRESPVRRALSGIRVLLWTTVAAEAALLPITALLFGRVTLAGLLLNFAAIPLMAVLQAASLAVLALSVVRPLAAACGYLAHLAAAGIVQSARFTDLVPWLARDVVAPAWWVVGVYYLAALTWILAARGESLTDTPGVLRRRAGRAGRLAHLGATQDVAHAPPVPRVRVHLTRIAGWSMAAAAMVLMVGPAWASDAMPLPRTGVRVAFLDVGQGDATAIVLPDGRAMLVDAGGVAAPSLPDSPESDTGGFDVGQRVVGPALRALGVRRLEALAVTHGDPDHIGGAPAILRAFHPGVVWDGVPVPPHPWLRALNAAADGLGLRWRTVQAGDAERAGPVLIRVLHPPPPDWERQRVRNEDSVVLDVRIGAVSIVLPGDIGREGEQAILSRLDPPSIVVLKAPHHGSATSSTPELLAALRPAAVIFSAGRGNRFGHPAHAVVSRYRALGVPMFSTAEEGAVIVDTDGREVHLWGWRSARPPLVLSPGAPQSRPGGQ